MIGDATSPALGAPLQMISYGATRTNLAFLIPEDRVSEVVAALHDLNLAAQFADQLIVLADGQLQAFGHPRDVLDAGLISRLYQVPVELYHDRDGLPYIRSVRRVSQIARPCHCSN